MLFTLANSRYLDRTSHFRAVATKIQLISANADYNCHTRVTCVGKNWESKIIFSCTKKRNAMIGTFTTTSDEIAVRDAERRNFSVRVLFRIYGTSYGAISTTPAGMCT